MAPEFLGAQRTARPTLQPHGHSIEAQIMRAKQSKFIPLGKKKTSPPTQSDSLIPLKRESATGSNASTHAALLRFLYESADSLGNPLGDLARALLFPNHAPKPARNPDYHRR